MPEADRTTGVVEWFATPLGRHLLEREQRYFDEVVADIFGYNAFQLGLPELDLLRASRMPLRCQVGARDGVDLRADFRDLPIASNKAWSSRNFEAWTERIPPVPEDPEQRVKVTVVLEPILDR